MLNSPLFDAPQAGELSSPEARGDAPRPDTSRTPWSRSSGKAGVVRPQPGLPGEARPRFTPASTMACIILALSPFLAAPASADQLTLTRLRSGDLADPKNAVASIMKEEWASEIQNVAGSYSFSYALFKAGGRDYLVSSMRGSSCRPDECTWRVQRLDSSYSVSASGAPIVACGEANKVDVTAEKLTICGKAVPLP